MSQNHLFIAPAKADYQRRAKIARAQAENAASEILREGFLKLAEEWERLANAASPDALRGSNPTKSQR